MQQPHSGLAGMQKQQYQPSIAQSNVRSIYSQSPFEHIIKQFKEYQAKSEIIDLQKLRASPALKLKKYKQSAYYGDIVNGKRHGQGVMIYQNERVYQGNWECDFKQGLGFQIFPNGSNYYGQYVNGKPEGIGKYTWPNGEFYEGEWMNGLKHGSGMWKGAKGDSYVGEWRMGKADGYGVHVWINGDRFEGQFKQCLKHGQGTEKFANGDLYKGQYSTGKPNGYGQYYWVIGSYFKGNFKDGLRDGHGMWKKSSGNSDKYEGEYCEDRKHGYGIFSWASGNIYKGNYIDDLRSGFGQMYWSDGSYYKGQWKNGIQHGQGILFAPGQGAKKGRFEDNVLVQIFEEENVNTTKAGSIHKNGYAPVDARNYQQQHQSTDSRRRAISTQDGPKINNIRISRQGKGHYQAPSGYLIKPQALKPVQYKITHTVDLQRVNSQGIKNYPKKQKIPHSAYYMHKLHKRVSTAHNESVNHVNISKEGQSNSQNRSKGEIVEQLKNFTRKMVGLRPSRLSSNKN